MRTTNKITPEQQQAIDIFRQSLKIKDQLMVPRVRFEHISSSDCKIFVVGKIGRKSLPNEHYWVWNQSNAQIVIDQTVDYEIVVKKLNPRKKIRTQTQTIPPFKIWVFVINNKWNDPKENLNFIWCERGQSSAPSSPISPISRTPSPISPNSPISPISPHIQPNLLSIEPILANNRVTRPAEETFTVQTVAVSLPDLSFLSTFMEPACANEIFGTVPKSVDFQQFWLEFEAF